MPVNRSLISIITVVYNDIEHIEETILSVLNQTYSNIEYIIIDGGSTDGTVDIIKKYDDQIAYWISELDNGIYDAMNKGIQAATGEWINFMNSGDRFKDSEVIQKISEVIGNNTIDLVYGLDEIIYQNKSKVRVTRVLEKAYIGMPFSHQSMFIKTAIHKEIPYSERYSICADYDFVCKLNKIGVRYQILDWVLVVCRSGGISDQYALEALKQTVAIARDHFSNKDVYWMHQKELIKAYIKSVLKVIVPNRIVLFIKKMTF